jgi:hypothetical protein
MIDEGKVYSVWQHASFLRVRGQNTSSGKIMKLKIIKHNERFRSLTYSTQENFEVISLKGPWSLSFINFRLIFLVAP